MQVLIIGIGTRGDVAPYTGLGARIREAGFEVTIAAHTPYASMVAEAGLGFRPIPGDPLAALSTLRPAAWAEYGRQVADGLADAAAQGADLLILNAASSAGTHVAEAMGIPSMGAHLQPVEPSAEYPPVHGAVRSSLGRWGNRTAGRLMFAMPTPAHSGSAKRLRARLGLPPISSCAAYRRREAMRWPVFHGFSPLVLPRPADWRPGLEVTGYWWPEPRPNWRPSPELADFLESGPPPAFVGFGSQATLGRHAERHTEVALAALRRAGLRGVLQTGVQGRLSDDVLGVGVVPHAWLFPRMAVVAHHAAAGTTAAGLRAGVPAVAMPWINDQPLWARQLHRLGVAPPPLTGRLTAERLAAALADAPARRTRAEKVGGLIAAEDGAEPVVRAVERAFITR
ncbi:glycosyltransferase [Nonomuraea typhae]|uniref:glycosyltransferase n=1 Tax=Nonomuraea typhae TaxID=2603600 RepID=UPI0012FAB86B|nr:glycosyltransferase [Nonomuraea typhae]